MKRLFAILLFTALSLSSAENKEVNVLQLLDKSQKGPESVFMKISIEIVKANGKSDIKSVEIYEKGAEKRLGKITAPKEDKGLAFLTDGSKMLMYLPAYKKVKTINSSSKSGKFANTDFSYEEMERKQYERDWTYELNSETAEVYKITLYPKEKTETQYSKISMDIDKSSGYPLHSEYFNAKDEKIKTLDADSLQTLSGYIFSVKSVMTDEKSGRVSIMRMSDIKTDISLKDDYFSERTLTQ